MTIFKRFSTSFFVLAAIEALLLVYFPPSLIFEPTLTAGGDTPSHFISAVAMRGPSSFFSPVTWMHGNFAGFPLFLQYFPLPFILMRLISYITSLQVAFKLVTLLAIIPLPAAVFYCLRRLGFGDQVPALGAVLSLPFLVQAGNSMWGANMASTLAGEFAYGISFILAIVYMGRLFTDVPRRESLVANSCIEALIALSNGYPILQAGTGSGYFLLRGGSTKYLLAMHAIAFGLLGFWIMPLIRFIPWNSPYAHSWAFESPLEIVPHLLWPSIAGALFSLVPHVCKLPRLIFHLRSSLKTESDPDPEQYLWWQFGTALLLFAAAPYAGLVDVRFIPFAQICLTMLGAIGWGKLISRLPRPNLWLGTFAAVIIVFSVAKSFTADSWILYNYTGMEKKPLWQSFRETNSFLSGSEDSPRVVYEHSELTNGAGSTRAFELLPLYAGRSTIEGLYMQSTITAPFAFYMESELSQSPTTPLPGYYYSRLNQIGIARHMRLFNANQVISASDTVHNALDESDEFELQATFPPFRVYLLKDAGNSYVVPLRFQPFRISDADWKRVQFEWFRSSSLQTPLIVAPEGSPGEFWKSLPIFEGRPGELPEIPLDAPGSQEVKADAVFSENKISVTTSVPGHPLWLKASYHPSWRIARGEGELYIASPTFMLLVPKSPEVILEFDTRSRVYLAGRIVSLISPAVLIGVIATGFVRKSRAAKSSRGESELPPSTSQKETGRLPLKPLFSANLRLIAAGGLMAVLIFISVYSRADRDPQLLYKKANAKFERAEEIRADIASGNATPKLIEKREKLVSDIISQLDRAMRKFPESYVFDHCFYLRAYLLSERMVGKDFREMIEGFLKDHPDTRVLAELYYLAGESLMREDKADEAGDLYYRATLVWPETSTSTQAGSRLVEIYGPNAVFERASELFESGQYMGAYSLFKALTSNSDEAVQDGSTLSLAYCCLNMNRWEEASNLFLHWLNNNFDSQGAADVRKALLQCNIFLDQNKVWQNSPEDVMPETTIGKILKFFNLAR